jgi:hypothetical protein
MFNRKEITGRDPQGACPQDGRMGGETASRKVTLTLTQIYPESQSRFTTDGLPPISSS